MREKTASEILCPNPTRRQKFLLMIETIKIKIEQIRFDLSSKHTQETWMDK